MVSASSRSSGFSGVKPAAHNRVKRGPGAVQKTPKNSEKGAQRQCKRGLETVQKRPRNSAKEA